MLIVLKKKNSIVQFEQKVVGMQDMANMTKSLKEAGEEEVMTKKADLDNIKQRQQLMEKVYNENRKIVEELEKMVSNYIKFNKLNFMKQLFLFYIFQIEVEKENLKELRSQKDDEFERLLGDLKDLGKEYMMDGGGSESLEVKKTTQDEAICLLQDKIIVLQASIDAQGECLQLLTLSYRITVK